MSEAQECIFKSDNVVAKVVPASDATHWVITFDNYGIGHGFDRQGFGENFLHKIGISAIHVMGRREDWYQYSEMEEVLAAVRGRVHGATRVMTYGSSMGGYAAIRFAQRCGAQTALALSPQYSIDPQKVPFDQRWAGDARRIRFLDHIDGPISFSGRVIVAYDSQSQDALHVRRIKEDISVDEIRAPFSGHPVATFLGEIDILKDIVKGTLIGSVDTRLFEKKIKISRACSSVYYSTISGVSLKKNPARAVLLAKLAIMSNKNNPMSYFALSNAYAGNGELENALYCSDVMVRVSNRNYSYLIQNANLLIRVGRYDEALNIAREVMENEELMYIAHLHAWIGRIFELVGDLNLSRESFSRARALDPGNLAYSSQAGRLENRLRKLSVFTRGLGELAKNSLIFKNKVF